MTMVYVQDASVVSLIIGHLSLYCKTTPWMRSLITYRVIPSVRKIIPKMPKMIMVEPKEGTGLHAGSICYLNLLCFSFSIFS